MALELCPALAQAAGAASTWAGLRPYTEDQLPISGPGPLPGLFLATGHFRNGILLAPITAKLVAQLFWASRRRLEPFGMTGVGPACTVASRSDATDTCGSSLPIETRNL